MRDDRDLILDMVEMCDLLLEHVADLELLDRDPVVQAAAQRRIEVLGEAASKVSDGLRVAHPEIPWREIVGTRVILAHAYFHIDAAVLRQVVGRDVPQLRRHLELALAEFGED